MRKLRLMKLFKTPFQFIVKLFYESRMRKKNHYEYYIFRVTPRLSTILDNGWNERYVSFTKFY